jgi:transglutaminase-like putative cysteine protease
MNFKRSCIFSICIFLLASCVPQAPMIPTFTQIPTQTAYPTYTPYPTYTAYPSLTPIPSVTPTPSPTWIRYRISYSIVLSKYWGSTKVWMPLPKQWDTQKGIEVIDITPYPSEVYFDSEGNQIIFWQETLEGGEPFVFSEEFEISILVKTWNIDKTKVNEYDPSDPVLRLFLGSTEYIQTAHPEIRALAEGIVGEEGNPYLKSLLIYDHVVDNFTNSGRVNDALGTLRAGEGQCGGLTHLYIALCRASGIPARPVTGIHSLHEGSFNWSIRNFGTHMWAEIYLPSYGWIPVDPSMGNSKSRYGFGVFEGDRLILSKGSNINLGHGIYWDIAWFHIPYVSNH